MNKFKLAQKRNYFKFVIVGLPKPIDKNALTDRERTLWNNIMKSREELIRSFEGSSRAKGLNVPSNRCIYSSCRNKANKYTSTFENDKSICKKHKIMEDESK